MEVVNGQPVGPKFPANFPAHLPPPNLLGAGFNCQPDGRGGIVCVPTSINVAGPSAPTPASGDAEAIAQLRKELEALKAQKAAAIQQGQLTLPGTPTKGGTVVEGAGGQTQRELLTTPGQTFFTRTTDKPTANLHWRDWRRLQQFLPANFNEEKYLANNPDVAEAVRKGAMPSGAYHYVMYGMGPGCHAGDDPSGKGKCDPSARSFAGWRRNKRPGYLSGIFANWNQAD
ncbi:hypothetical protein C4588_03555 [Candidatus Parcubacteria bacterium]|nr:MAG: hypothetical protein C4588_03555 [Candidatus Parcubacteria bacterium]